MLDVERNREEPLPGDGERAVGDPKARKPRKPERLVDASIALPLLLVEVAWLGVLGYGAYKLVNLL